MSKLAHSNTETMEEIDFWRAYEAGALEPMETAPRDGREIMVAFPDDQAPNQNKVRALRVVPGRTLHAWLCVSGPFKDDSFFKNSLDGWIEP